MDTIRFYVAMLIAVGGLIFISQISVSEEKKVDKVPILWPVDPGTNRISCPLFQKIMFLPKEFQYLIWHKCVENCQSEDNHIWQCIARMNHEGSIHYENGTDAFYTLYTDGILEIQNVSAADNNTEYRCDIRTWDLTSVHIMLRYYKEQQVDGKWSAWGAWSPCTKTCGYGTVTRKRVCNIPVIPAHGGAACRGDTHEAQVCLVGHCSTPPTSIRTKSPPVDGKWSAWGAWSPCTKTCGYGTSTRGRVCNNPVPVHGGAACRGNVYEVQVCLLGHCSTPTTSIRKKSPPAPPTSIRMKSPTGNADVDCKCTGLKIGLIVTVTLLLGFLVFALVVLWLKSSRYSIINGNTNQCKECGRKETLDDNDDVAMINLS